MGGHNVEVLARILVERGPVTRLVTSSVPSMVRFHGALWHCTGDSPM